MVRKIITKSGKAVKTLFQEGVLVFFYKIGIKVQTLLHSSDPYKEWIRQNERDQKETEPLQYQPLISVVIPVYNTEYRILEECIQSVLGQTYENWELCMADDASTMPDVKKCLRKYEGHDRIRLAYREKNGHISRSTNTAIGLASGEFIAFMDCDDTLAPNALYEVAKKLNEDPGLDFIYSDEDKLSADSKKRSLPFFKPDWSPDTFMTTMYTCHLGVYRKAVGDELGWLNPEYDGAQDYDFTMRFAERTQRIGHISKVLYHWRMIEGSTAADPEAKDYVKKATAGLKEDSLKRRNIRGEVEYIPECYQYRVRYIPRDTDLVSIIIPTKDNFEVYRRCVDSIIEKTEFRQFELVTVDNGSSDSNRALYTEYHSSLDIKEQYIYDPMEFNFSRMCNIGAAHANGNLLLFLNDDMEVIHGDWLDRMAGHAGLSYTGAVGAKLIYHGTNCIQHIGVVSIPMGPIHIYCKEDDSSILPFNRNRVDYNYSAVTAACLMVEKSKYQEVGGFDESFAVAYNDVKFCFDLWDKGYYNVCKQDVKLYHYESFTRGSDATDPDKMQRLIRERRRLYSYYPRIRQSDPFYNINLLFQGSNVGWQKKESSKYFHLKKTDPEFTLLDDKKVHVRIEEVNYQSSDRSYIRITGWFIREGSLWNNMRRVDCLLKKGGTVYRVNTVKLYQIDMDKVAELPKAYNLSSFYTWVDTSGLEEGEYDIFVGYHGKWYATGGKMIYYREYE